MTRLGDLRLAGLADNAMLFKDLTQWLRNRTFLFLFFGLLAVAEVILLSALTLPGENEDAGMMVFTLLAMVLFVYTIIIGFLGHNLTAREFLSQTFELYELSGMSLERMAGGKLVSMLAQFLFGFFCLVPFMFVAFLLGGLDFYLVLSTCLFLVLLAIPLYLLALFMALLSKRRQVSSVLRWIALVFGLLLLPWWGGLTYIGLVGIGPGGDLVDFVKSLLALDGDAIRTALIFLVFYIQICLLVFYGCCHAISPSTDSRATSIQLVFVLLTASYLGLWCAWAGTGHVWDDVSYLVFLPPTLLSLIVGLVTFYGRPDVPAMAAERRRRARFPLSRLVYACFHTGNKGALKTLAIFFGLCVAAYGFLLFVKSRPGVTSIGSYGLELDHAASIALQVPFFLGVPAWPLILTRRFNRNLAAVRTAVFGIWVVLGIPLMIVTLVMMEAAPFSGDTESHLALQILAVVASPFSSMAAQSITMIPVRDLLGVVGLLAMVAFVRAHTRSAAGPPSPPITPQG